ncbi:MAG: methionine synthase [Thermoplasmatota archaeon]
MNPVIKMRENNILETTVVGSYPQILNKKEITENYYDNNDPYIYSIEESIKDQIEAGIEMISDGQTRKGMIELYADGLLGFRIKERTEIISQVKWKDPITIEDQRFVRKSIPENISLKGIITGPWTIYNNSIDMYYKSDKDAVMDISTALSKEVVELSNVCDYVQIDEPFFSVEYPQYAEEIIHPLTKNVNVPTILHVCGDVDDIIEKVVELDVDVLDHEFAENPYLYDSFKDIDFEQRISAGVVSTKSKVESTDTILDRIKKAYKMFGKNCMIDPDCGLRHLSRNKAISKLENMVNARDLFLKKCT